jgi:N-formylmaleamate deformylase
VWSWSTRRSPARAAVPTRPTGLGTPIRSPTWTDAQVDLRAEWLHTCDIRAIKASFDGFHTDDFHRFLPQVNVPALLMTAERGDVVQAADVQEIESLVPGGVQHHRVPAAGHMIPWDNEEGFYAGFGEFLGVRV